MRRSSKSEALLVKAACLVAGLAVLSAVLGSEVLAGEPATPAQQSIKKGLESFNKGRLPEAAEAFQKAAELDPANPVAFNNLGLAYVRMGRTRDAVDAFESAVSLRPTSANFQYNLARIYQLAKNYPKAIEHYQKTVALDPGNASAHAHLGQLYGREEGRYGEAIEELNKSLALEPDNAEAYYSLAVAYYSLKNFGESWSSVKEAQRLGYEVNPAFLKALRQIAPEPQ
jgi:tetratricopeptide (TPR) repeat protein